MKKRVIVILEVESEDDMNISDEFIKNDLEQEISCASNYYETISIQTTEIDDPPIFDKQSKEKITHKMTDLERKDEELFVEAMIHLWIASDAPSWITDYVRKELRKERGLSEET